jgi:hypothetical protein
MSSVREATPEVIGLAGVIEVPPMRDICEMRPAVHRWGPTFRDSSAIIESVVSGPRSNGMGTSVTRSGEERQRHR